MTREQVADERIREWLHEEASGQLPDWVLETTFDRTRTQPQRRAWPGWRFPMTLTLRRPATAPPLRAPWVLILAALLALALVGGALVVGARLLLPAPPDPGPLAVAMPPTACPPGTILKSGDIATIAGTGVAGNTGDDGPALEATLTAPYGIAVGPDGAIYVGNASGYFSVGQSHGVRRIGLDGVITTAIVGPTTSTPFKAPTGLAFDESGNLFVADFPSARIWRVDSAGVTVPVAGTGVIHFVNGAGTGDDGPALDAQIPPTGVAIGPDGDIYFDDVNEWRRVDAAGIVHRFAGDIAARGYGGDNGPAVEALINGGNDPLGIAADRAGNVYLPDPGNGRIRMVDPSGIIRTIAGNGGLGNTGDNGSAIDAAIGAVHSVAVDETGNLYLATSHTVRRVDPSGIITTVAGNGTLGAGGDCGPAVDAQLDKPTGIAVRDGVVYIVDGGDYRIGESGNNRVRMIVP